mmetsp:Transcript_17776/g.27657  ORF Transcript_17776/g.27657 Transcript_17776/m.27657 type:complete len:256 (-) Transcript_17776:180-947(-)
MLVRAPVMPRVGRMITNHVKSFSGESTIVCNKHAIHVLIVTPRKHKIINAAMRLIDPVLGVVAAILHVRVQTVEFWEHHGIVRNLTADNKCVTPKGPLFPCRTISVLAVFVCTPEEHNLAHVMNETGELKPVWVTSLANAFGCLHQMQHVRQVKIGIRGVNVILKFSKCLLDRHLTSSSILKGVLLLHPFVELHRMIRAHVTVMFNYPSWRIFVRRVNTELVIFFIVCFDCLVVDRNNWCRCHCICVGAAFTVLV